MLVAAGLALLVVAGYVAVNGHGWDARDRPGRIETAVAARLRTLALPDEARDRPNPVPAGEEAFRDGLAHFADHCATCDARVRNRHA